MQSQLNLLCLKANVIAFALLTASWALLLPFGQFVYRTMPEIAHSLWIWSLDQMWIGDMYLSDLGVKFLEDPSIMPAVVSLSLGLLSMIALNVFSALGSVKAIRNNAAPLLSILFAVEALRLVWGALAYLPAAIAYLLLYKKVGREYVAHSLLIYALFIII